MKLLNHKLFPSLIPVIVIVFLVGLFFGQATLGKTLITNGDFSGSDLLDLHLPFKFALSQAITHGQLPLWNINMVNGFPLFAEGQTGVFYPPNLIFSLLPAPLALNYSIILTFILAGFFTYLYCRSLAFSRFSSLSAAIIFIFSAF
ncbi:MAG: hypothetical protein V1858_00415, partial [Candidatus Gottesmanbacteria bacterium]